MAVKIELKRSAVPGKVPTVSQLDLGELAINTYDGKVYLKQDNGVQTIIEVGGTAGSGSAISSSYALTASFAETASYFSGSISNAISSSYSDSSSLALANITTASISNNVITFTKGDATTFNLTISQSGSAASTYEIVTGSIAARVNVDTASLFLIKSASTDYFNIASDSTVTSYSNLFIIKNFTTQQPVFTVNDEIMFVATHSVAPTVQYGGFWFTSASLYIGVD
jgi:hypothetical protein